MTENEMFEKSFQRPSNFFDLGEETQFDIDESLGILDWSGDNLSIDDYKRYIDYYNFSPNKKKRAIDAYVKRL